MFKTMELNELMNINGGYYYVPVYRLYTRKVGNKVYREWIFIGKQLVAEGSGIKEFRISNCQKKAIYW